MPSLFHFEKWEADEYVIMGASIFPATVSKLQAEVITAWLNRFSVDGLREVAEKIHEVADAMEEE